MKKVHLNQNEETEILRMIKKRCRDVSDSIFQTTDFEEMTNKIETALELLKLL